MKLKNHANLSLFGYLVGVLWALTGSFAEGVLIIVVSFLYSKIWHLQNTDAHIEEFLESEIKSRKRRVKK